MTQTERPHAFEHRFQLLTHQVSVLSDSAGLHDVLRFLTNSCRQSIPITNELQYEVRSTSSGFELMAQGQTYGTAADSFGARAGVYERMHPTILRAMAADGWTRLHGGLVEVDGRSVLVTGSQRAGKSTLCLRLLFDGANVGSDESTMVRDGKAVAYPRRLHLRERTADVIPELRPVLSTIPVHQEDTFPDERGPVHGLDPTSLGFDWRAELQRIDAIFYLNPNHGSASILTSAPKHRMAMLLSKQAYTMETDSARVIAEVSAVVRGAECYELELGSPEEASSLVRGV